MKYQIVGAGETIFEQGDHGHNFYIILKGAAIVSVVQERDLLKFKALRAMARQQNSNTKIEQRKIKNQLKI